MSNVSVNYLLDSFENKKNTLKYKRYENIIQRMKYEKSHYNTYFLLGVLPIEFSAIINIDLLKMAAIRAVNMYCNSKNTNVLEAINSEYRLFRKLLITVRFDIDEDNSDIESYNNCNYIYDITCFCCNDNDDNDDSDIPMF